MIIPPHRLILLDTNVLIHLARNDVTGQAIRPNTLLPTGQNDLYCPPSSKAKSSVLPTTGSGETKKSSGFACC